MRISLYLARANLEVHLGNPGPNTLRQIFLPDYGNAIFYIWSVGSRPYDFGGAFRWSREVASFVAFKVLENEATNGRLFFSVGESYSLPPFLRLSNQGISHLQATHGCSHGFTLT